MEMSQSDANNMCHEYFGTNLASMKSEKDNDMILELMNDLNVDECWIGLNDTIQKFVDNNDLAYYEWMDGNINAYNKLNVSEEYLNSTGHCISITSSGQWFVNECDEEQLSCAICNVVDDPVVAINDQS